MQFLSVLRAPSLFGFLFPSEVLLISGAPSSPRALFHVRVELVELLLFLSFIFQSPFRALSVSIARFLVVSQVLLHVQFVFAYQFLTILEFQLISLGPATFPIHVHVRSHDAFFLVLYQSGDVLTLFLFENVHHVHSGDSQSRCFDFIEVSKSCSDYVHTQQHDLIYVSRVFQMERP